MTTLHDSSTSLERGSFEPNIPFSLEQEFLTQQYATDGSSPATPNRPISSGGWRITGELDTEILRKAFDDVLARHEPLRSALVFTTEGTHQAVWPRCSSKLRIQDLPGDSGKTRDTQAEEFLNEIEQGTFNATSPPSLRAYLGRFDGRDHVLSLVAFQPLIDVWSVHLLMRELAECYAARRGGHRLSSTTAHQYREYVSWQQSQPPGNSESSYEYWRNTLRGAQPIALTADRPPAVGPSNGTRRDRFTINQDIGSAIPDLSRSMRSSQFMVLFAVYLLHLRRRTAVQDGVVWTLTPGTARHTQWMKDTIGYFVNMVPLRVDLTECQTFRQAVDQVRAKCLEGYRREVPFIRLAQEAPEAITALEQPGMVVPGFQMTPHQFVSPQESMGDVSYAPICRRTSQEISPDIPDDAILWTIEPDPSGGMIGSVNSSIDRFARDTIADMIADFLRILHTVTRAPDISLNRL